MVGTVPNRAPHRPGGGTEAAIWGYAMPPRMPVWPVRSGPGVPPAPASSADGSYLTSWLALPEPCRQTRIAELVNDLDPKLKYERGAVRGSALAEQQVIRLVARPSGRARNRGLWRLAPQRRDCSRPSSLALLSLATTAAL